MQGLLFKADFERAYDSVNGSFLDFVLENKGFGCSGESGLGVVCLLHIFRWS